MVRREIEGIETVDWQEPVIRRELLPSGDAIGTVRVVIEEDMAYIKIASGWTEYADITDMRDSSEVSSLPGVVSTMHSSFIPALEGRELLLENKDLLEEIICDVLEKRDILFAGRDGKAYKFKHQKPIKPIKPVVKIEIDSIIIDAEKTFVDDLKKL